jgi:hypothetical protein
MQTIIFLVFAQNVVYASADAVHALMLCLALLDLEV